MSKSISKSLRISNESYEYIMKFDEFNKGFNDALERMIVYFSKTEKQKKQQLELYELMLNQTYERLRRVRELERNVNDITNYLHYVEAIVQRDVPSLFDNSK